MQDFKQQECLCKHDRELLNLLNSLTNCSGLMQCIMGYRQCSQGFMSNKGHKMKNQIEHWTAKTISP